MSNPIHLTSYFTNSDRNEPTFSTGLDSGVDSPDQAAKALTDGDVDYATLMAAIVSSMHLTGSEAGASSQTGLKAGEVEVLGNNAKAIIAASHVDPHETATETAPESAPEVSLEAASFAACYQQFMGAQTTETLGGQAQTDRPWSDRPWLPHPWGKVGCLGIGSVAAALMAGPLLSQGVQPQTADAPKPLPDVNSPINSPTNSSKTFSAAPPAVAPPAALTAPEFAGTSLKPLANLPSIPPVLQVALEATQAIRAPLPGQVIRKVGSSLSSVSEGGFGAGSLPAIAAFRIPAIPGPVAVNSPAAAPLVANPDPVTSSSTDTAAGNPALGAPAAANSIPKDTVEPLELPAELPPSETSMSTLPATFLPVATLTAPYTAFSSFRWGGPGAMALPPSEPSSQPASSLARDSSGAVLSTPASVTPASRDGGEAPTSGISSGLMGDIPVPVQPSAKAFSPGNPANLPFSPPSSPVLPGQAPTGAPGDQSAGLGWQAGRGDANVLSVPNRFAANPTGLSGTIEALPWALRVAIAASHPDAINNLKVVQLSAQDYQATWKQAWLTLPPPQGGQPTAAPEHGFIDYERKTIVVPAV